MGCKPLSVGTLVVLLLLPTGARPTGGMAARWGVWGHTRVTRWASYALPTALRPLYKQHLGYLEQQSLAPDRRRYLNPAEAPRHYIDLEFYRQALSDTSVLRYADALARFGADSLRRHGELPWAVHRTYLRLVEAFAERDLPRALRLSAELSHYIADACVPLHTTVHYDGHSTQQRGIHALWESTLPERYGYRIQAFIAPAVLIEAPLRQAWGLVQHSHSQVDSVLSLDLRLRGQAAADSRLGYSRRGRQTVRAPAADHAEAYHALVGPMVESQLKRAAHLVASYWLTAWVEAGQPDVSQAGQFQLVSEHLQTGGGAPEACRH